MGISSDSHLYCRIDGVNSLGTVVKISRNKVNEKVGDYE